ncbi:hypothetical protein F383_29082 [Gossypium arboreum]|uniref:Uncharacterized protein n=1 Tax=Gossypium arboreum TaxID=29729 RepID=A0A0B0PDL8_GOSAR|nr:hypothetical protein F383_29082 [Gossypium arboreum]
MPRIKIGVNRRHKFCLLEVAVKQVEVTSLISLKL